MEVVAFIAGSVATYHLVSRAYVADLCQWHNIAEAASALTSIKLVLRASVETPVDASELCSLHDDNVTALQRFR